jgi:hypothetical protein
VRLGAATALTIGGEAWAATSKIDASPSASIAPLRAK